MKKKNKLWCIFGIACNLISIGPLQAQILDQIKEEQFFFELSENITITQVQCLQKKQKGVFPLLKIKGFGSYQSLIDYMDKFYEKGYYLCPSSTFKAKDKEVDFHLTLCFCALASS